MSGIGALHEAPALDGDHPAVAVLEPGNVVRCDRCEREAVEVEYVRADLHAGALEENERLRQALTDAVGIVSGGRNPNSALNRKADEWRALLRGQYEGSVASRERQLDG